jgi:hypothetical protein
MELIEERLMRRQILKVVLHMTCDSERDVFRIRFDERPVVHSVDTGDNVIVGVDANGEIEEMEILDLHGQLKVAEATLVTVLAENEDDVANAG